MDAKQAITAAKRYVRDVFSDDNVMNIGLEELRFDYDSGIWLVTIGFTRRWEGPQSVPERLFPDGERWPRTFKTVEVADSGEILGLRHWPIAA